MSIATYCEETLTGAPWSQNFDQRDSPAIKDIRNSFISLALTSKKGMKSVPLEVCKVLRTMLVLSVILASMKYAGVSDFITLTHMFLHSIIVVMLMRWRLVKMFSN